MDTGKTWQPTQPDGLFPFPSSYQDTFNGLPALPSVPSADMQWQHMVDALISSNSGTMQYQTGQMQPSMGSGMRHSLSSGRFDEGKQGSQNAVILKVGSWASKQQHHTKQQQQQNNNFTQFSQGLEPDYLIGTRYDPGDGGLVAAQGMPGGQDQCGWDNAHHRQSLPSGLVESGFPVCKVERQDVVGARSKGDVLPTLDMLTLPSPINTAPGLPSLPPPSLSPPWRGFSRTLTGSEMAMLFPDQVSCQGDIHIPLQFKASGHTDPVVYSGRLILQHDEEDEGSRFVSAMDPKTRAEIPWHVFNNALIYWQRGQAGQLIMCIQDISQIARNCPRTSMSSNPGGVQPTQPAPSTTTTTTTTGMQQSYMMQQSHSFGGGGGDVMQLDPWSAQPQFMMAGGASGTSLPVSQGMQSHAPTAGSQFGAGRSQDTYQTLTQSQQTASLANYLTASKQPSTARLSGLGGIHGRDSVTSPPHLMGTLDHGGLAYTNTTTVQRPAAQQQQQQQDVAAQLSMRSSQAGGIAAGGSTGGGSSGGGGGGGGGGGQQQQGLASMVPMGRGLSTQPQFTNRPPDAPPTSYFQGLTSLPMAANLGRLVTTNATMQPSSRQQPGSSTMGPQITTTELQPSPTKFGEPKYIEPHQPTGNDLLQGLQAILQRMNKRGGGGGCTQPGGSGPSSGQTEPDSDTKSRAAGCTGAPDQLDTLLIHDNNPQATQSELPNPASPTGELVYTKDVRGMHLLEGQFDRQPNQRSLPLGMSLPPSGLDDLYPLPPTPKLPQGLDTLGQPSADSAPAPVSQTSSMRATNSCLMVPPDARHMISDGGSGWLHTSLMPISQLRTVGDRQGGGGLSNMPKSSSMPHNLPGGGMGGASLGSMGGSASQQDVQGIQGGGGVSRGLDTTMAMNWQPGSMSAYLPQITGQLPGNYLPPFNIITQPGRQTITGVPGLGMSGGGPMRMPNTLAPVAWGEPPPGLLGLGSQGITSGGEGLTGQPGKAKRVRRKPKDSITKRKAPEPRPAQPNARIANLIADHGLVVPSFNRRIVGRNFYLGRSFMTSIFGAGFQCPLQCQLQLQINGELHERIYKVEFVSGSTSWYPRGLPLSLLRGREMCGARWQSADEAAAAAAARGEEEEQQQQGDIAPADRVLIMVFQDVEPSTSM